MPVQLPAVKALSRLKGRWAIGFWLSIPTLMHGSFLLLVLSLFPSRRNHGETKSHNPNKHSYTLEGRTLLPSISSAMDEIKLTKTTVTEFSNLNLGCFHTSVFCLLPTELTSPHLLQLRDGLIS